MEEAYHPYAWRCEVCSVHCYLNNIKWTKGTLHAASPSFLQRGSYRDPFLLHQALKSQRARTPNRQEVSIPLIFHKYSLNNPFRYSNFTSIIRLVLDKLKSIPKYQRIMYWHHCLQHVYRFLMFEKLWKYLNHPVMKIKQSITTIKRFFLHYCYADWLSYLFFIGWPKQIPVTKRYLRRLGYIKAMFILKLPCYVYFNISIGGKLSIVVEEVTEPLGQPVASGNLHSALY